MTWPERLALAVLLAVVVFLVAGRARADEGIARRLSALKALTDPSAAPRALPAGAPSDSVCIAGAWWRSTDYGVRERIDTAIRDASVRFALDPKLIRSVIQQESAYDVFAVSHKGAMGLMQLMPGTARELGVVCAFDPRANILGGARYLRELRDHLGSWPRAVAAYHAGPRRVRSGRLPQETRGYATRVLRGWQPARFAGPVFR